MTATVLMLGTGFALAFAESGLGLGMFVPGETVVVVLAASTGSPWQAVLLGLAVMIGACAGDHVGYLIGRRYGDALRDTRIVRRLGQRHYDRATDVLRRRGGAAIFCTRLVPVVRTLTPAVAGASGLEYRRFVTASLAGSALWATVYVGGGSAVRAFGAALATASTPTIWLLVALVLAVAVPLLAHRAGIGATRNLLMTPPRHIGVGKVGSRERASR